MRVVLLMLCSCFLAVTFLSSCTFVYETEIQADDSVPDITLEDMEWVRFRRGDEQAKLEAKQADRFEKIHIMELQNYTFEQYNTSDNSIDSSGSGGKARIELETSNFKMTNTITIDVASEEMSLTAEDLEWYDREKTLQSAPGTQVHITQKTGTDFLGTGFSADVRARTWLFSSGAEGAYYFDDENEE
ncbi:MAG: LPS export ABC transporter periplasmic protein LptC [Spirochaetaceae bacterium]|jgi:LPS export ABC transporter protein LptC|nr:LPS export ABC transporter periplasmic protein LptC [Spirochaetaceae bacterium]